MKRAAITPTFPMEFHGSIIYSREDARTIIQLELEDRAAKDALQLEKKIQELMDGPHHYTRAEARFIAMGGTPSGSVSSFL